MAAARIKGVLSPVVTPFKRDLSPDLGRFVAHCKWLLSQDCGLAVFGTNSEANSMSAKERMGLLETLPIHHKRCRRPVQAAITIARAAIRS
jgi:4-hydroxy-tetrahydrodipicolinate synthase